MTEKAKSGTVFSPTDIGPFSLAEVQEYAEVSGDSNPIHLDRAVATRAGLAEPIVQGMLIVGHLVRLAEAWCEDADVSSVRSTFVRPVGINEILHVEGREVDYAFGPSNPRILRMIAKNDGGMIAIIADVELKAFQPAQG